MLAMSITWIGGQPLSELSILKAHERNLVEAIARGESVDPSARLADATALLNRNKPQARQMLKQLIGERNR